MFLVCLPWGSLGIKSPSSVFHGLPEPGTMAEALVMVVQIRGLLCKYVDYKIIYTYINVYIPGKPKTQNFLVIMGKSRNAHFFW
jgi:hypothetical protein